MLGSMLNMICFQVSDASKEGYRPKKLPMSPMRMLQKFSDQPRIISVVPPIMGCHVHREPSHGVNKGGMPANLANDSTNLIPGWLPLVWYRVPYSKFLLDDCFRYRNSLTRRLLRERVCEKRKIFEGNDALGSYLVRMYWAMSI